MYSDRYTTISTRSKLIASDKQGCLVYLSVLFECISPLPQPLNNMKHYDITEKENEIEKR